MADAPPPIAEIPPPIKVAVPGSMVLAGLVIGKKEDVVSNPPRFKEVGDVYAIAFIILS
jgi:hypothetical protein